MDLIIIRHGLPISVTGAEGPADPHLTDTGRDQAERMAAWLQDEPVDAIYCSPMNRARETAAPLALLKGLEVYYCDGLAEIDQFSAEYIPLEELRVTNYELWRRRMKESWFGEQDPKEFRLTVVQTIEQIVTDNAGRRIAIVCHGGVINAWGSHTLGLDDVYFFQPTYTSINRFAAARSGERTVVTLNEAAHLR